MRREMILIAAWWVLSAASSLFGQGKDLGAVAPTEYPLCIVTPNVAQAYGRYQATGVGKLFSSPAMAPFTAELRKTGALSLVNWQGILGFDEKLLSGFPAPGVVMAVPAGKGLKGNIIFLIQTAKDDKAIDACLKSAESYLVTQKAKKTPTTLPGTTMAVVFDTPSSPNHPVLQHVYFYTDSGFFGVSSSLAAVKEYLSLKLTADKTLAANTEFASGRKQLKADSDLYIYSRPLETLELWETPPRKGKSTAAKMANQGFKDLAAITAVVQFTGGAHDIDYQAIFFTKKPPYKKGMRVLQLSPGPEEKTPPFMIAGLGEISQFNHDQDLLYLARANWYDELEVDGDDGAFEDIMDTIKRDKGVDFRKEIFGQLKEAQIQAIDVGGPSSPNNLLGRKNLKISEAKDPAAVVKALTKFYEVDVKKGEVKFETVGGASIWWVKPPKPLLIDAKSASGQQVNTMAVFGKYYIMANDTDLVRKLVQSPGDFATDKVLAILAAENRKLETKGTGARTAIRWEEVWAAPFEAVRSADPKYDKENEVKLLRALLTGDNTLKYAALYKLLPPFSAAKPFLSPAGSVVDVVPDGLMLKGYILKP